MGPPPHSHWGAAKRINKKRATAVNMGPPFALYIIFKLTDQPWVFPASERSPGRADRKAHPRRAPRSHPPPPPRMEISIQRFAPLSASLRSRILISSDCALIVSVKPFDNGKRRSSFIATQFSLCQAPGKCPPSSFPDFRLRGRPKIL